MKINWDVNRVINECRNMYYGANDHNLTGWVNWPCKQDLYRVKFAVDEMLAKTNKFVGEEESLKEQEQIRLMRILKDEM